MKDSLNIHLLFVYFSDPIPVVFRAVQLHSHPKLIHFQAFSASLSDPS
ncbi:hypothetical protein GCWU000342_02243 [Shuttleworthella satelles DSM 14600]|uniref:Uncharacterized protein n=1 Tax=Shuttleworthella satelles DSM 14600 TaxID=626523 RepID=C4GDR9_9FIRM|nr:hypothetical protein GCWU000342_02243 [Shuttleworthia satelles DSM 14600]